MQLTPSDIYAHHRPSKCDLRLYLKENGMAEAAPSPYAEVLKRLGHRHERTHLGIFAAFEDLSGVNNADELFERTKAAVGAGSPVIYQGLLKCRVRIAGVDCEVSGRPDFIIRDDLGHKIRDSKISLRITRKDHPEIILQMQTYGWLFERVFQTPIVGLEVHKGNGDIVPISYDGPDPVVDALRDIVSIRKVESEFFSPIGTSKCNGCEFHDHCWDKAKASQSAALVNGVDLELALALHQQGVLTIDQLREKFDEDSLSKFQRPQGRTVKRVGTKAISILRNAKSLATNCTIVLCKPDIPFSTNYVMFDLEGLPPHLDELKKIYLWGMQVFGETPSEYLAATAGFGPDGDKQGWEDFLAHAETIFNRYGDLPFVVWGTYEGAFIKEYLENRFGDASGRAARVKKNLCNLLRKTEESIVLPLSSYSLKVVEKYVKFTRTLTEVNGSWAMAKYIKATETNDEALRAEVMDAIRTYNREDLEATWAVLQWLLEKGREADHNTV
jgi:predicted RecB family nuclease